MKILHTGDWHIGKLVHGVHMTIDQRFILDQLVSLIEVEKPDVLIISGDLYDRSVPPVEAVELLDDILTTVVMKNNTKVIAIAGNHDSPDRVGFASKLLRANGLFISGNYTGSINPITINDEFGAVNFYPIPFTEPAKAREVLGDDLIKNQDSAMKHVLDKIYENMDSSVRNICIAHAYMMGTLPSSESVRPLSIGGSDYVDAGYFTMFDYVALGHLHRPQKVGSDSIRYAGSLLKYSFSEAMQKKSVTMIEMDGEGNTMTRLIQLEPLRDMRIIKGSFQKLMDREVYSLANTDDYIMAIITDKGALLDPISQLRSVYPNILRLEREEFNRIAGEDVSSANDIAKKDPLLLFEEFFENVTGEEFSHERAEFVKSTMDDINRRGRVKS